MGSLVSTWDLDGFVNEQKYYCSLTPMNPTSMPAAKAVLAGDVREYTDTAIAAGQTYYIRIGAVKNGVEKISNETIISIDSYASLSFIAAGNAGLSEASSSINCPIPAHSAGDVIVIIARAAQDMVVAGYEKIFSNTVIKVFAKIAISSQASQTLQNVPMTYGAVASVVLRPDHPVSVIERSSAFGSYTSAAVANDTVPRVLTTPSVATNKPKFELNIVVHGSSYTPIYAVWANQTAPILATRNNPSSVPSSFNFAVFGKFTALGVSANGGSIEVTKIPPSAQSIDALSICISAK